MHDPQSRLLGEVSITLCMVASETGAHEGGKLNVILLVEEFVSHVTAVLYNGIDDEFDDFVVTVVRSKVQGS